MTAAMSFRPPDPTGISRVVDRAMEVVRELFTPLMKIAFTILDHASPNMLWTVLYGVLLFGSYLFHSPFRAHSAAVLDTYGRMMKVLQIWLLVLISFVHLGPVVVKTQQAQMRGRGAKSDDFSVAYLFIPLCMCLMMFFSFFHKMKRRWKLGVTYGASLSTVLLNSMMLATLATVHYAYMSRFLREGAPPPKGFWANAFFYLKSIISPSSVVLHPARAINHLLLICGFFIFCDYQYKRRKNFDPTRGILWADLFDLRKEREESSELAPPVEFIKTGARKKQQDWRLLEDKPHRYRPEEVRSWQRTSGKVDVQCDGAALTERSLASSVRAADDVASPFRPYEYQHVVHDAKSRTRDTLYDRASPFAGSPSSFGSTPSTATAISNFPDVPLSSIKLDFPTPSYEITEIREAKHPIGKPGMVAWWSSFAFSTAFQMTLNAALKFLTFDVRSLQGLAKPKVFSFVCDTQLPSQTAAAASPASGDDLTSRRSASEAPAAAGCDMWFDWIADIGDGFNPTYDMARILAQPRLRLTASNEASDTHNRTDTKPKHADTSAIHTASPTAAAATTDALVRQNSDVAPSKSPTEYTLPRGSFVVVGGDLAYPRPTEETYTSRLFEPYRDALSGNPQLRKLFHARQMELIQPDEHDPDLAHIRVLDAETVAATACGADTLRASRGTAEEALHSVPMLFAIPGNHDWFDGLRIFRKYIMDKTWIGGWLMPQQSSFFVLRLPYNWFMLCCDTGTQKDIDVTQRNYFLDVIEKYMDASSCVIVASHEPGWIEDSWPAVVTPTQPQIAKVAQLLGTRLRLRVAGDIHNYSRHAPTVPGSQNPMLVTSGGGGAFMHEVTRAEVVAYGEAYHRVGAFPPSTTLLSFLPRLWGFRIGNWKFDILIGLVCFLSVTPMLLTPALEVEQLPVGTVVEFVQHVACAACQLFVLALAQCGVSLAVFLGFFASFLASTSTGTAPILGRLLYCAFWTLCVSAACYGTLAFLRGAFDLMSRRHLLVSDTQGGSLLEQWVLGSVQAALLAVATWCPPLSHVAQATLAKLNEPRVNALLAVVLRSLDPFEMLRYTTNALHAVQLQQSMAQATPSHPRWGPAAEVLHPRLLSASFYTCYLLFYWMTVIPFVSFIIGCFLFFTTKLFQSVGAYDAAYSSFQIEDYKSFVRFKIDGNTRALHAYTIGVRRVPKLWVRDERFMKPYATDPATRDSSGSDAAVQPPHLQRFPSRWKPSFPELSRTRRVAEGEGETELELPWDKKSTIVDEFVCYPHKPNA